MPTIQQQLNQLKRDKETLNTMLNTMGVETKGNETFTQLTPLVGKIVTNRILQDKSITITENGTLIITADEGFDGLNKVEIVINVANSSQEIIIDKQYVDTFVAGTIDGTRPPTYINSVNDNRAQYIGFNLKIIPGEEYTFVGGTSNFNFAVMQIGQDTVDNVLNGASFDANAGILANTGWTSNNFTFTAVEGATNVWISAKKTSGSDFTTSDLKNLLPCYIEGPVYKG